MVFDVRRRDWHQVTADTREDACVKAGSDQRSGLVVEIGQGVHKRGTLGLRDPRSKTCPACGWLLSLHEDGKCKAASPPQKRGRGRPRKEHPKKWR